MKNAKNEPQKHEHEAADVPEPAVPAETVILSSQQAEELQKRAAKADENWDRLLRTTADFDNFKKRAARERQEAAKFANEGLIQKLIPILDNFEMALSAAGTGGSGNLESLKAGIAMIHQQL